MLRSGTAGGRGATGEDKQQGNIFSTDESGSTYGSESKPIGGYLRLIETRHRLSWVGKQSRLISPMPFLSLSK